MRYNHIQGFSLTLKIAVAEWVAKIREMHTKSQTQGLYLPLQPMKDLSYVNSALNLPHLIRKKYNDGGYVYVKPVPGRIHVSVSTQGSSKTNKVVLKNSENTIGRSSSCTIFVPKDEHMSRAHAKIVIENNVPFMYVDNVYF